MARREYRSKTGKLLGYSQNESDRTGGKGGLIFPIFILIVSGIGYLLKYFHLIGN
jgi:hypothetical protein